MMDKSKAVASLKKSSSERSQATSSNAGTSRGELVPSSEIFQATSSLNPGTSQGEDPSPSASIGRERTLDENLALCGPLLQAAIKGDWPQAEAFLKDHPECVRAPITKEEGTALHVAVIARRTTFIKELLKLMSPVDLMILKTNYGFTALHSAAQSGIVGIAKQLVNIHSALLMIPDEEGDLPLNVAANVGHAKMVSYLFPRTRLESLTEEKRIGLLLRTIFFDMYDIALEILGMYPMIPNTECWWAALEMLATKPFSISSESQLSLWKSRLNSWFKVINNKALTKTLAHQFVERLWKMVGIHDKQFPSYLVHSKMITLIFEAAKVGNVEFLIILARSYPNLLWEQNEYNMSIFHIAVEYRHESVFNMIYELGAHGLAAYDIINTNDNMLHLAGKLAPLDRLNIVSGAALQMQQELLWFQEIKKIVPPSFVHAKNKKNQTPQEIFINEHEDLQKAGEIWMRNTAEYCMLVATLITTVIFAATFTVPGGNDQETGTPIFFRRTWFMVFFISNAVALCFSSISIVIFLSILTSRYTEKDFLKSLPLKLVFGLATLFISMAGMMVAFSATGFLVYSVKRAWAPIVATTLASLPVTLFVWLHHKLWVDTFRSTYKSRFLFRSNKHRVFQRKMSIGELIRRKFEMKENCLSFMGC